MARNTMNTKTLIAALVMLCASHLYAAEEIKTPYYSTEIKNDSKTLTMGIRVHGQPDTSLLPGRTFSVTSFPTAGGLFNASPSNKFKFVSIAMTGCTKEMCITMSDSETANAADGKKSDKNTHSTPDFEIFNASSSNITVHKAGDSSWVTIPKDGKATIHGILDSGFTVKGQMEVIQIDRQKCETPYCYRVLQ
jgi:hypothetical protein